MDLKNKKVLFVAWGCENPKDTYMYQIYYLILRKFFPLIETFDTKKNYFQFGKESMNSKFLKKITEKKYDLILFAMEGDEFFPETLKEIRDFCPETKTLIIICDDDARFDSGSRYYSLFFNYVITSQDYVQEYKKDGIKAFFHLDYNTYKLSPQNLKKTYDVTFIGRPKADRNEIIKYLLEHGINIKLFGWDWYKYDEFKDIYLGPLNSEDYAKVINQTKINLGTSKAGYVEEHNRFHMKARIFEVAFCKSFQLIEKFPRLLEFFNEKEIGMYNSQEDMLKKIKYYLKHEKEREKMAERAYKKTLKNYNREKQLRTIFTEVFKEEGLTEFPTVDKKIITLNQKDVKNIETAREKIKDADYITFDINPLNGSKLKNYFLSRAIQVTDKPISCSDYYVSSRKIKDYALFLSKFSFKRIGNEASRLIDINSIMVKKNFFLDNFHIFRDLASGKSIDFFSEQNTAFVSIPLVSIKKMKKIEYEKMKKAFEFRFQNELFSLMYQKKLFFNLYPYHLVFKSLRGNSFITRYLLETLKDQSNRDKLSVNSAYIENSPLQKFKKNNQL